MVFEKSGSTRFVKKSNSPCFIVDWLNHLVFILSKNQIGGTGFVNMIEKKSLPDQILKFISDNNLSQGEALPSERKLSEIFCASRNSIRESLRQLEAQNIVKIRPGSGCYIKTWGIEFFTNPEPDLNQMAFQNLEARLALDPDVMQLALERINEKEISRLKGMLVKLSRAILSRDISAIIDEDNRIRITIACCTKNRVLALLVRELEKSNYAVWSLLDKLPDEDLNRIFGTYVKLINCIESRNSRLAKQEVRNQITMIFSFLRSLSVEGEFMEQEEIFG